MPRKDFAVKDPGVGEIPSRKPAAPQGASSSEGVGDRTNLRVMPRRINGGGDDPVDPAPVPNPSGRPCMFVLDSHIDEILLLARRGRDYRNIARTYGVSALEIWRIVTTALSAKRAA